MTQINDGGPAFARPLVHPLPDSSDNHWIGGDDGAHGMSLRDYFAAKAMQGMLSASYGDEGYVPATRDADFIADNDGQWCCLAGTYVLWRSGYGTEDKRYRMVTTFDQRLARDAYDMADAMLAAREQKPGGAS